jgi:hypothetical protein
MPAQHGFRRDEQPVATSGRQQPAHRSKQRPIAGTQRRTLALPAQDLELMTQHEQLEVLDVNAPAAGDQQLQQRHERAVHEREGHRVILSQNPKSSPIRVLAPFTVRLDALRRHATGFVLPGGDRPGGPVTPFGSSTV